MSTTKRKEHIESHMFHAAWLRLKNKANRFLLPDCAKNIFSLKLSTRTLQFRQTREAAVVVARCQTAARNRFLGLTAVSVAARIRVIISDANMTLLAYWRTWSLRDQCFPPCRSVGKNQVHWNFGREGFCRTLFGTMITNTRTLWCPFSK